MRLYRFINKNKNHAALTPDATGSNLPQDIGPWEARGDTNVEPSDGPRVGGNSQAITVAIEEIGYFITPFSVNVNTRH